MRGPPPPRVCLSPLPPRSQPAPARILMKLMEHLSLIFFFLFPLFLLLKKNHFDERSCRSSDLRCPRGGPSLAFPPPLPGGHCLGLPWWLLLATQLAAGAWADRSHREHTPSPLAGSGLLEDAPGPLIPPPSKSHGDSLLCGEELGSGSDPTRSDTICLKTCLAVALPCGLNLPDPTPLAEMP